MENLINMIINSIYLMIFILANHLLYLVLKDFKSVDFSIKLVGLCIIWLVAVSDIVLFYWIFLNL
jgi:hypothetical protein